MGGSTINLLLSLQITVGKQIKKKTVSSKNLVAPNENPTTVPHTEIKFDDFVALRLVKYNDEILQIGRVGINIEF